MNTDLQRARTRQMFIFLLVSAACLALIARLYYWQILQAYDGLGLANKAHAQHTQEYELPAPRGLIYDRNGALLATNVVRDDLYLLPSEFRSHTTDTPEHQAEAKQLAKDLRSVLPNLTEESILKALTSEKYTVRLQAALTPEQSQKLRALRLRYVFLEPITRRVYPGGDLAAHILGFTQDGKGVYGVEQKFNTILSGKSGHFQAETDLYGNPLTVGLRDGQQPVNGSDLTLTIDSSIQYYVQQYLEKTVKEMKAESGSVIVLDAKTGAVISMAGYPSYDPNDYSKYAKQKGCLGRQDVFINPLLYCDYEPGSTMKAVTIAAGLDQGLITPETKINDPGYITFPDAPTVNNWDHRAYGEESMTEVLAHSANVGTAYVAYHVLGPDRFYPYLAKFGFGQKTDLLGPEVAGVYRTNKTPGWTPSDLTRQAFGQSISASPLQVAMAYQCIANRGLAMKPYLVQSVKENGKVTVYYPQQRQQVISAASADQLNKMLQYTVKTSYAQSVAIPGYSIAAKTGTATTQGISDDLTEASLAGFFPATDPKFVILVKLDRPQTTIYGSTAAAPLWKAIAQQLIWYYHIPPDQRT